MSSYYIDESSLSNRQQQRNGSMTQQRFQQQQQGKQQRNRRSDSMLAAPSQISYASYYQPDQASMNENSGSNVSNRQSRASLLSSLRTAPGRVSASNNIYYNYNNSGYDVNSIPSQDETIMSSIESNDHSKPDYSLSLPAIQQDESMDPQMYAALQAKQKDLMATSLYIAQQQQRIQVAMYTAMQQQQQQPMESYTYAQDANGNIWYQPVQSTPTGEQISYTQTMQHQNINRMSMPTPPPQISSPQKGSYQTGSAAIAVGIGNGVFGGASENGNGSYSPGAVGKRNKANRKSANVTAFGNSNAYNINGSKQTSAFSSDDYRQRRSPNPGNSNGITNSNNGRNNRPLSMAASASSSGSSTPTTNSSSAVVPEGHPIRQPTTPVSVEELLRQPQMNFRGLAVAQRSWMMRVE